MIRERIVEELAAIERVEGARIFYACESGSRAWGFPSADSDYDVRFLYARPVDWYLSIDVEEKRDVIERPISDQLDINGWDLRKALQLLRKSNPPLLEWLNSPIVYLEQRAITVYLQALLDECYSPVVSLRHYLHMAQGNFREYLRGDIVRVKKYFYVLRPLLAVKWLEERGSGVPVEFAVLVDGLLEEGKLKREINRLIELKREGFELDSGPRIPVISEFIEAELTRLEKKTTERREPKPNGERLNEVFRQCLQEIWQPQGA